MLPWCNVSVTHRICLKTRQNGPVRHNLPKLWQYLPKALVEFTQKSGRIYLKLMLKFTKHYGVIYPKLWMELSKTCDIIFPKLWHTLPKILAYFCPKLWHILPKTLTDFASNYGRISQKLTEPSRIYPKFMK
jgi:hypothetical protein